MRVLAGILFRFAGVASPVRSGFLKGMHSGRPSISENFFGRCYGL